MRGREGNPLGWIFFSFFPLLLIKLFFRSLRQYSKLSSLFHYLIIIASLMTLIKFQLKKERKKRSNFNSLEKENINRYTTNDDDPIGYWILSGLKEEYSVNSHRLIRFFKWLLLFGYKIESYKCFAVKILFHGMHVRPS